MIQTLNKHVRWRTDRNDIFICDCKHLFDLKLPLKFEPFMKKLESGIEKENLNNELKKVFSDFEKTKLLSILEIRQIKPREFDNAIKILDEELGRDRVRNKEFLFRRFKEYPEFFIGIFLDNDIIGIICGFPRDDYLLMSEIAIDSRFHNRGFGKRLVKTFEDTAKRRYNQINVGVADKSIYFYESLEYKPFLLIQFEERDYSSKDFNKMKIIKTYDTGENIAIEVEIKKCNLKLINDLRKKYPKAWFQYIFTKRLK